MRIYINWSIQNAALQSQGMIYALRRVVVGNSCLIMAHQSGIGVSVELQSFISECKDSSVRAFKVVICDEKMELGGKYDVRRNFEQDFDDAVKSLLDERSPAFIMVRLDNRDSQNHYGWILIAYSPDGALVREKMTYASTRSSFKRIFGSALIVDEIYGNRVSDVLFKGYQEHVESRNAPAPLTDMELVQEAVKKNEVTFCGVDSGDAGLPGLSLQLSNDVNDAFRQFSAGNITYLQLSVNVDTEQVIVSQKKSCPISEIPSLTPPDEPRFHFINYKHEHEGKSLNSKVFIYSTPGFKSSIKQRMIYSTCKSSVLQSFEQSFGPLDKRIELGDATEITEAEINSQLYTQEAAPKQMYTKPKRPGRA